MKIPSFLGRHRAVSRFLGSIGIVQHDVLEFDPAASSALAYPLQAEVARFRERQGEAGGPAAPAGWSRGRYLRLAGGIVRHFAGFQDARGAIVDPYEGRERQYATPCFACAAAVLHASGGDRSLLAHCIRAMDAACDDLLAGRAADRHPDFYTVMLMQALNALRRHAPPERIAAWEEMLRRLRPERIYRFQPSDPRSGNWSMVAAAGEWRRFRAGLSPDADWVEATLGAQIGRLTEWGLYRDPGHPMAYDQFARYFLVDLLSQGYDGRHRAALDDLLERGAWTSLFMQSASGDAPVGGRSAQHQWNEASHAMTAEFFARRFAGRGDLAAAGAFKRAARLSAEAVGRWVRPSGELWIVKNRYDPARRHGFESYSFHSTYNLLTAAKLAMAYWEADDRIAERPCPAETGGFVFALQPAFHKLFGNAAGMSVEIDTGGDARYDATGLLRVQHPGVDPGLGLTGAPAGQIDKTARRRSRLAIRKKAAAEPLRQPMQRSLSITLGPSWRDRAGNWHALADHDGTALREAGLEVHTLSRERVEFTVVYRGALRGGATEVRERYAVTAGRIEITGSVDGDVSGLRQCLPLLLANGGEETAIALSGATAILAGAAGSGWRYEALGAATALARLGRPEPSRNGFLDAAYSEAAGRTIGCAIEPIVAAGAGPAGEGRSVG